MSSCRQAATKLEARPGIEPGWKTLHGFCVPLRHRAGGSNRAAALPRRYTVDRLSRSRLTDGYAGRARNVMRCWLWPILWPARSARIAGALSFCQHGGLGVVRQADRLLQLRNNPTRRSAPARRRAAQKNPFAAPKRSSASAAAGAASCGGTISPRTNSPSGLSSRWNIASSRVEFGGAQILRDRMHDDQVERAARAARRPPPASCTEIFGLPA